MYVSQDVRIRVFFSFFPPRSQGDSSSKTFGKQWFRDYRTHCMRDSHVAKASIYIGQNNVKNAQKHPSSLRDSNQKPHCSGHPYDNQNKSQPQDSILMGYDAVSIGMKSLEFWNSLVPPLSENSGQLLRNIGNYLPISATSYSRRPTSSSKPVSTITERYTFLRWSHLPYKLLCTPRY